MPSDPEFRDPRSGRSWLRWLSASLVLFLILVAVGAWMFKDSDPFILDRPDVKEAAALRDASMKGPLTDAEFGRAVELLSSARPVAQLSLIAILQIEGSRTPARREPAIRALEGLPEKTDGDVRKAARTNADRLRNPPPPAPAPDPQP